MTDGAALPLALSDLVAQLRDRSLLDATDHVRARVRRRLRSGVGLRRARDRAAHRRTPTRPSSRWGPGIVGTGDPARVQRHRGRARARRRHRARRRADRVPARVVRRPAGAPPRACRTTARPRSRSRPASRALVPVPCVGGEPRSGCSAPTSRPPGIADRHEIVDVPPIGIVDLLEAHGLHVIVDGPARGRRSRAVRSRRRGRRRRRHARRSSVSS